MKINCYSCDFTNQSHISKSAIKHNIVNLYKFLIAQQLIMATLHSLISAVVDRMSTILPHMVCLSVSLECRAEMYCTRLTENTGRKKIGISAPSHNFVRLYLRN